MTTRSDGASPALAFTFCDTIACFRAHLPRGLVTPDAERQLVALGAHLPATMTNWAHIECRLDARPQTDLIIQVEPLGRAALTRHALSASRTALAGASWNGIRALARQWERQGEASAIGRLWLEFDLPADDVDAHPAPSVFIELSPDARRRAESGRVQSALRSALAALGSPDASERQRRLLARCVEALPRGATLFAIGAMMSRVGAPLRLCLMGIADDALGPYLDDAGWPGDWRELGPRFADAASAIGGPPSHAGIVHLDLGDDLLPRLGVELVLDRRAQVRGGLLERGLLDRLVEWGCCTPDKSAALLTWAGVSRRTMPHELWPSLALRRVNHVKLVHASGQPLEAKAYLCMAHEHDLLPRAEARL